MPATAGLLQGGLYTVLLQLPLQLQQVFKGIPIVGVNRGAYTLQSSSPDSESGRCYYYRPKGRISLSQEAIRKHLEGQITIGLYAINPSTQRCKWVAIDADYPEALDRDGRAQRRSKITSTASCS